MNIPVSTLPARQKRSVGPNVAVGRVGSRRGPRSRDARRVKTNRSSVSACPALSRETGFDNAPPWWVTTHRPRGPRSGPGYSVPVRHHLIGLIRPTRRHIAISPHGGLCAMPSLCGSAEATREWFRAFAAHYFLTCRPLRSRGVRHRYAHALDTVRAAREWFFSAYVSI